MVRSLASLLLLVAPAQAWGAGSSFLGPAEEALLERALAEADLVPADLLVRDAVNGGLPVPRDRWRTASVEAAAEDPAFAAARAAEVERALSAGGPGSVPDWAGLWALTEQEFGPPAADPCAASAATLSSGMGLIDRMLKHAATGGDRWSKRDAADLRQKLDGRIDAAVGRLLDAAAIATCRVAASTARIDGEARAAVARALEAQVGEASAGDETRDERAAVLVAARDAVDLGGLLLAGRAWSDAVSAGAVELAGLPDDAWPTEPIILPTDLGEVWIGSPSPNSGTGDPVLLVDPGGDDQWRLGLDTPLEGTRAARGWIDLGGDDLWLGRGGGPGGAFFSVSAGVDAAGDDTHRGDVLAQGAAAFGVATWHDAGGRDVFRADGLAQGAALFGVGALRLGGDAGDTFDAGAFGQGAGLPGGLGVAVGGPGDDAWTLARGRGQGAGAGVSLRLGGGIGVLLEAGGDDTFVAGPSAQGASDRGGLGLLIERGGDDRYLAGDRAQGACTWGGAGLLADRGGDDAYQGGARSEGVSSGSCQGWLLDAAGDDAYAAGEAVLDLGGVGVLVDAAGGARFSGAPARVGAGLTVRAFADGTVLVPAGGGGGGSPDAAGPLWSGGGAGARSAGRATERSADARALLAATPSDPEGAWTWGERIAAAAPTAGELGPLLEAADDLRPDEALALEAAVGALVARREPEVLSGLVKALSARAAAAPRDGADPAAALALRWLVPVLGADLVPPDAAVAAASPLLDHPAWPVRAAAFDALAAGALRAATAGLSLAGFEAADKAATVAAGGDRVPEVRAAASRLLGHTGRPAAAATLAERLRDGAREERSAAELALTLLAARGGGQEVARAAFRLVDQPPSPSRNAALRVLGATGHADAEAVLREAIEGADARAAVAALRGYAALGPPDALDFLEPLLLRDLATPVRRELLAAVEALTPSER